MVKTTRVVLSSKIHQSVLFVYYTPELAERVLAHLPERKLRFLFADEGLPNKFNMSCEEGDKDIVTFLMEDSGVGLSKSPGIDRSCYEWCADVISMPLKDPRVNIVDDYDQSIIHQAAYGQELTVALLLASPSINLSYGVDRALVKATSRGHSMVVSMLLNDLRLNPSSMTEALHEAATNHHVGVCLILSRHPLSEWALSHADEF